jgi:heat shock protein HslJ
LSLFKSITLFLALIVSLVASVYFLRVEKNEKVEKSYKDATYIIDGENIKLVNGKSEKEVAPGSASKILVNYFGNEVFADFDGDGRKDVAFLLTKQGGGSGTFYYLVVGLNKDDGYVGSSAVFIGDRISPQGTSIDEKGFIVINYADRNPGESFAVAPSLGKSLWLKFDPKSMQLGEVVQNFEGEADPSTMTLGMKKWSWVSTQYNDDKKVLPKNLSLFSITFKNDGTFSATTDCNGVGGEYKVTKNKIVLDKMISTLMYCEGSQESEFTKALSEVSSYMFTSKGELVLELKLDSGTMLFK